jgi:hypothetical protein
VTGTTTGVGRGKRRTVAGYELPSYVPVIVAEPYAAPLVNGTVAVLAPVGMAKLAGAEATVGWPLTNVTTLPLGAGSRKVSTRDRDPPAVEGIIVNGPVAIGTTEGWESPAVAVTMTDESAVAEAVTGKETLVCPAGTTTEAGTVRPVARPWLSGSLVARATVVAIDE